MLCTHGVVFAQAGSQQYTVLAPLPGTDVESDNCTPAADGTGCTSTLSKYLPGLFNLLIGVGAVAAFVVITIYGLELMLSDSLSTKMNAKAMLENALWGLGLIIFAYVILYTINPNLLNGNLNVAPPTVASPSASGAVTAGGATACGTGCIGRIDPCLDPNSTACTTNNTDRTALQAANVQILPTCYSGDPSQCLNLANVSTATVNTTIALQQTCGCSISVTGGTEHQPANALDMSATSGLNQYLVGSNTVNVLALGAPIQKTINGQTVTFTYETAGQVSNLAGGGTVTASGDHWHVTFSQ